MSFIRITLDFENAAQAAAAMSALAGLGNVTQDAKPTPASTSSKKPSASADAGEKTPSKPSASTESAEKPAKPAEAEKPKGDAAEPFPYATLQKAVMELVAVDPTGPKAILEHFGIPTFKGSDPAIWEDAKARLEKATAAAKAAQEAA